MEGNSQLEELLFSDGWYAVIIVLIMLVSGLIGGLASYYLNESEEISMLKSFVLGVVASLIVPLFLNMISSNLLFEAQRQIDKIFIFAGFCLLASVFSKNFLENMYNKILQKVGDMGKQVKRIEEASSEPDIPTGDVTEESLKQKGITKIEYELLNTLSSGRYTYRSVAGLIKQSDSDRNLVSDSINTLLSKKLIESRYMGKNQIRYFISSEGRKTLGELSVEQNNNT